MTLAFAGYKKHTGATLTNTSTAFNIASNTPTTSDMSVNSSSSTVLSDSASPTLDIHEIPGL